MKPKQAQPMTLSKTPEQAETPKDESESRAQDCRAKAAYCKWVARIIPDKTLRTFYAKLSVEWEKEAGRDRR
jgi:hypothetical protein